MKYEKWLTGISALLFNFALQAAPGPEILDISGSACGNYITETWNIAAGQLAVDNGRIYTCASPCADPRMYGVEVTEGLSKKLNLKAGRLAKMLRSKCKPDPNEQRTS